jgi:hypothetical protein
MMDPKMNPAVVDNERTEATSRAKSNPGKNQSTMSKSMHDGVEVWCDCCSCEAEPYWVEAMKDFDEKP